MCNGACCPAGQVSVKCSTPAHALLGVTYHSLLRTTLEVPKHSRQGETGRPKSVVPAEEAPVL